MQQTGRETLKGNIKRQGGKRKGKEEKKGQKRLGNSWCSFVTEDPTGNYKRPFLPSQMVHCSNFHSAITLPNEHSHGGFFTVNKNQADGEQNSKWLRRRSALSGKWREETKKSAQRKAMSERWRGDRRQVNKGLTSWTGPGGQRSCSRCCLCSSVPSGLREREHTRGN